MNLVWLRNDLRLEDNPALHHANKAGPSCCVYVLTPKQWKIHQDAPIKISLWRERLAVLSGELAAKNIPLKIIRSATYHTAEKSLLKLAKDMNIEALWFNHEYPLNEAKRDREVVALFNKNNIPTHRFHGDVIHAPGTVRTQMGKIYHVYSPFARQWRKQVGDPILQTLPAPRKRPESSIKTDDIDTLWPKPKEKFREDLWPVTTKQIHNKLNRFAN